eukprot:10857451-Lingulodinium_polyedra.AAC.1
MAGAPAERVANAVLVKVSSTASRSAAAAAAVESGSRHRAVPRRKGHRAMSRANLMLFRTRAA